MAERMSAHELHWREGPCRIDESKGAGSFRMSGVTLPFRILDSSHIEISGKRHRFYVVHNRDESTVWLDGRTYYLKRAKRAIDTPASEGARGGDVRALMPGKLLRLAVNVGDLVSDKQTVAIMESMKMESALLAPKAGRVSEIRFKAGDVLEMGTIVLIVE
jgi:biotin carboxyl carrier protein